jgi:hypothetical protein
LSTPAIAAAVGYAQSTIDRDQKQLTQMGSLDIPTKITTLGDKPYTRPDTEIIELPQDPVYRPTTADQERRHVYVVELWKKGVQRDDIADSLDISTSTITADLATAGIGGRRPHEAVMERGTFTTKINWHKAADYDSDDWRERHHVTSDRLPCQINNDNTDKVFAKLAELTEWCDWQNDCTGNYPKRKQ